MTKLTQANVEAWTRAKAMEVAAFAEKKLGAVDLTSRLVLKISTNRNARSRGGLKSIKGRYQPWTSLHVAHFAMPLRTGSPQRFKEYNSIAKHPIIGDIPAATAEVGITALIVHELAHVIDYYTDPRFGFDRKASQKLNDKLDMSYSWADGRHSNKGGHGPRWQALYALLRIKFVNNGVTDPKFKETKPKVRRVRKAANRTIETKRIKLWGGDYRVQYIYQGRVIAVGRPYWDTFRLFTATPEGGIVELIHELEDGRGARKWVRENLI